MFWNVCKHRTPRERARHARPLAPLTTERRLADHLIPATLGVFLRLRNVSPCVGGVVGSSLMESDVDVTLIQDMLALTPQQ